MSTNASKLFDDRPIPPGDQLRLLLDEKGWTQDELATITGRSRQHINDLVMGRTGITPETAMVLAAAFGNNPTFWLTTDTQYRLSRVQDDYAHVQYHAHLFDMAPIKDMQRRGWIKDTKTITELDVELKKFFGVATLDEVPQFPISTRRTDPLSDLTPSQRSWCFRARQMAKAIRVCKFDVPRLGAAQTKLRALAAHRQQASELPEILGEYGIRFVVVEPIAGAKIDGAAFWLDETSPVIAVSVRFDRVDAFWFTVMHEFAHIRHGDAISIDTDLAGEESIPTLLKDEVERRADEAASAALVPPDELESFIRRQAPLYAKPRIVQFAHRIKMHPGVIVGQLQYLGEIGYSSNREMLVKIRDIITSTALTDGWGQSISPNVL